MEVFDIFWDFASLWKNKQTKPYKAERTFLELLGGVVFNFVYVR